ncbi:hypothetical protein ROT00_12310 [Agromyces mediolanus]|uniref:hypothetical protein n=1 Tax=Agromyces mediolanus TaxID=41986 RepID=UPI0038383933
MSFAPPRTLTTLSVLSIVAALIAVSTPGPAAAAESVEPEVAALEQHGLLTPPDDLEGMTRTGTAEVEPSSASVDSPDGLTIPTPEGTMSLVPAGLPESDEVGGVLQYRADTYSIVATTTASGVANAMYAVLSGPDAPDSYRYEVTADGYPALLVELGGAILVRNADGEIVNVINPAWAIDASGTSLPTHYEIEGNEIIQVVDHRTATYPVVADPAGACDALSCTIFFNKSETKTASEGAAAAAGLLCGAMAFLSGIGGLVCGAYGAALTIVAIQARNQGDCLAFRASRYGLYTPYPFIYDDARCR